MSDHSEGAPVEAAHFCELHQGGMGKVLGITFPYAARHRVIAQLDLEPEYLNDQGSVASSIVMALADCANGRSEEHTSELQSHVISYAVICLKKKKKNTET